MCNKVCLFPLLIVSFGFCTRILSVEKESPIDKEITVEFNEASLRQAISEIAQQTGLRFVYDDDLLNLKSKISGKFKDKNAREILKSILENTGAGHIIASEAQIILVKKEQIKKQFGTIKGSVVNSITGDALPNANVEVLGTSFGAASNQGGQFSIKIKSGEYDIRASMIGYEAVTRTKIEVKPDKTTYLTFLLLTKIIEMQEVRVTSTRDLLPKHMEIEPSVLTVRRQRITEIPTIGEPDLFRALQALPGVSAPNDYSNELFIRGGNADQNLVLLDGAVVYNPYHLAGVAGAINPDIVEQVNLSLGGFSARYGDRLSSVIDIQTRSNVQEKLQGYGNFSLLSSKVAMMGSILNSKINWIVSGRRSYHDRAVDMFYSNTFPYYFYDLYGKIIYKPSPNDWISVSSFFSRDIVYRAEEKLRYTYVMQDTAYFPYNYRLKESEKGLWDNLILSARWQKKLGDNFQLDFQLSQSLNPTRYGFNKVYSTGENSPAEVKEFVKNENDYFKRSRVFATDNEIGDRTFSMDFMTSKINKHEFNFGTGVSQIKLNYYWKGLYERTDIDEITVFFDWAPDSFRFSNRIGRYYFYVEDQWRFNNRLTLRSGIRFEKRNFNKTWVWEPRFNFQYRLNGKTTVRGAYGLFHQGLATAAERGYIQLLPLIFPVDEELKLEKAHHVIFGIQHRHGRYQLNADAYYKRLDHLIKATTNAFEFVQGSGSAYGLELNLRKNGDRLKFNLSYVLSYSKRKFGGVEYNSSFDQRHQLSWAGNYYLGKNWNFNFRWLLATGRAFTPNTMMVAPKSFDINTGEWFQHTNAERIYGDFSNNINPVRYPFYHRLDISFVKRIQKSGWALLPYIQILNSYFHKNIFLYYEDYEELRNDDGTYLTSVHRRKYIPMMPLLPTFGLSIEF